MVHIANRGPGEKYDFEAREIIDAGFLELVRYGIRRADDPLIVDSLKVVDHALKSILLSEPAGAATTTTATARRRTADHTTAGVRDAHGPCWRANAATTSSPPEAMSAQHITAFERFSSRGGMLPEQIWDYTDIPERRLSSATPPAPRNPWSGLTPNISSSSAPSPMAGSSTVSPPSRSATPSRRASARFTNHVEIFQTGRPLSTIEAGHTLRIVDPQRFQGGLYLRQLGHYPHARFHPRRISRLFRRHSHGPRAGRNHHLHSDLAGQGQPDRWLKRNIEVSVTAPLPPVTA